MVREWVVLVGGVVWTGLAAALLVSWMRERARRRRAGWAGHLSGGVRPAPEPDAPPPPAKVYANVKQEHREWAEDAAAAYRASRRGAPHGLARLPATSLTLVLEHWVRQFRRYARRTGRITPRLAALRAIIEDARRRGQLTPAESSALWEAAEAQLRAAAARYGRPRIAHRRDGIRLSDELTRELLKEIFGADMPT